MSKEILLNDFAIIKSRKQQNGTLRLRMRNKFTALLAVAMLVSLIACGKKDDKPLPRLVKVIAFGQSEVLSSKPTPREQLNFDTSGQVIEVLVSAGNRVQAGQALARIIPTSLSVNESGAFTSYKAAKAELASAEADYQRYQELRTKNFISQSELDRRTAGIEVSRAKYEQSLDQLGFVTLRAPEAGVLKTFQVKLRDPIEAKTVIGSMVFSDSSLGQEKSSGPIKRLPLTALLGDGKSVYRVKLDEGSLVSGVVEVVGIQTGQANESSVEVIGGLQVGDQIIATGWHALDPGQKVRIALAAKTQ